MKKLFYLAIVITVIISASFMLRTNHKEIKADSESNRAIAFMSYRIERGDTLWSIANKYITPEYESVNEYISVIKRTNHMTSTTLYEGHYLIIPFYYDLEPMDEVSSITQ